MSRDCISKMNPIQVSHDGGRRLNVLGIPMVIRIHGRDTGGVVSAVESHDVAGGGPPPHIHHREDETFQILEGEYERSEEHTSELQSQSKIVCRLLLEK